jgi:allantoin racemase
MLIRDIVPVRSPKVIEGMRRQRQKWATNEIQIDVQPIEQGPFSMEFATEEVLAGPYILKAIKQAEEDKVDAIILDCCVDPILRAARETTKIPVIAPLHAGLHIASMLGYRIAVLSMRNGQPAIEEHIRAYGFDRKVSSMHIVDCPPADLIENAEYCREIIEAEINRAVNEQRADVILFACTAMSGYIDGLQAKFTVPVVEPIASAIAMARSLVSLNLSHSKICYETLPVRGTAPGSIDIP